MTVTRDILDAAALETSVDLRDLASVLEALTEAEAAATSCSAAMVSSMTGATAAVLADLDLADVCHAAQKVLGRSSSDAGLLLPLLDACSRAAERSHAQCVQHAHHHAHCRLCSNASQRLIEVCGRMRESLSV